MVKRIVCLCLLFSLVLSSVAFAESVKTDLPAGVRPLPIDFTPGIKPGAEYYLSKTAYEDPSIKVELSTGRYNNCDYWVGDIKIADASQLRTISAGGFTSSATMTGVAIAKRANAVLAIDGDYFCYTGKGYILRQGELFLDDLAGDRDVLLVDANGDFHAVFNPEKGTVTDTVDGIPVINAFYFGPILVDHGEKIEQHFIDGMAYDEGRQRMAIGQVGPLEYKVMCCAGPSRGSRGMTLDCFATFVAEQGVQVAYNLDGGDSSMIIFNGKKINDPQNPSTRQICDMIYFASAYDGSEVTDQ